jgi:hypothetical protein
MGFWFHLRMADHNDRDQVLGEMIANAILI